MSKVGEPCAVVGCDRVSMFNSSVCHTHKTQSNNFPHRVPKYLGKAPVKLTANQKFDYSLYAFGILSGLWILTSDEFSFGGEEVGAFCCFLLIPAVIFGFLSFVKNA